MGSAVTAQCASVAGEAFVGKREQKPIRDVSPPLLPQSWYIESPLFCFSTSSLPSQNRQKS